MTKEKLRKVGKIQILICLLAVVVVSIFGLSLVLKKETKTEVITTSTLEKIVNLSELSTFESVYNGVAEVMNEKNSKKTDYYVAYQSKVKASMDFEKIDIQINSDEKKVLITLPEVQIENGITVDISSLEFIFVNDKANTGTVSSQAYKECIADVEKEITNQSAIIELAKENAEKIVKALISPFINQLDEEYIIEIQ